ncbi:5-oxoprolinase subunit PxpB [Algibacter sp. R77976]|uniref:5-oxoprolinase subunit PxpB n=1 Tax=Algibacter sp. R77976 TaxID=3093873 RepID=UPI0037CC7E2C
MAFKLSYKPFGEYAILIEWPAVIQDDILFDILHFKDLIKKSDSLPITEVRSAYNSLLVIYNEALTAFDEEIKILKSIYKTGNSAKNSIESRLWNIPVCYDAPFALDLEEMSQSKNISQSEIIKRHSDVLYTVCFIGFLPGFLYLSGLNETLFTPRKATPRLKVEKGAIAIGGNQTGVYPIESPGGWHIIGNSPIQFFNPVDNSPCFAKAGDQVKFYPVDIKTYNRIKDLIESNKYTIESEVIHG